MAGGVVAGWFVAHDALNYEVLKFVAAMLIFMVMAVIAAFWPTILGWFRAAFRGAGPKK